MINVEKEITELEGRIKTAGYSINDACFASGMSRATFQNWKGSVHVPDINRWAKLHKTVEVMGQYPTDLSKRMKLANMRLVIEKLQVEDD